MCVRHYANIGDNLPQLLPILFNRKHHIRTEELVVNTLEMVPALIEIRVYMWRQVTKQTVDNKVW